MVEIYLSLMGTEAEVQSIAPWIEEFERRSRVSVKLTAIDWVGGWETIVKMALQGKTPDISEIGTTWIASLASMNVLRPFSPADILSFGGREAFLSSSWNSCIMPGDLQIWAVPWLSDAHILYYRRDVLEEARITPEFATPSGLESTLAALQNAGYPAPISLTTNMEPNLVHDAASWVWREGGEFVDASGTKVAFDESKALSGFVKYFNLRRFLAPGFQNNQDSWNKFLQGERLVAFATPSHYLQAKQANASDVETWGAAPVAGSSFVGGTNLVVWKNSRQSSAVLDLARFLAEKSTGYPASPHAYRAPCRVAALNELEESGEAIVKEMVHAINTGHSYKANRLWGMIEKGLVRELSIIWETLLDDPASNVEATVGDSLQSLARRLNLALAG